MPTLRDLRERALLSSGELAKLCAVTKAAVSLWESGEHRPSAEHQRKLVTIFKCSPDELLAALRETKARYERRKQNAENERPAA